MLQTSNILILEHSEGSIQAVQAYNKGGQNMHRGTTPKFTFQLPIEAASLTKLSVAFRQAGRALIEKGPEDCTLDGMTVTTTLTEEETLSLTSSPSIPLEIQLRAAVDEERMASQVFTVTVERILKDGVL